VSSTVRKRRGRIGRKTVEKSERCDDDGGGGGGGDYYDNDGEKRQRCADERAAPLR